MSTEQENFDDLLKSKLSKPEFAFNEANWDKAEALIITATKKRKRRRVAFIFFIGLILGVGVMIPFIGFENKKVSIEVENKVKIENSVLSSEKKAEDRIENKVKIENMIGVKEQENEVSIENSDLSIEGKVNTEKKVNMERRVNTAVIKITKAGIQPENKNREVAILNNSLSEKKEGNNYVVSESKKTKTSKVAKIKTQVGRGEEAKNGGQQLAVSNDVKVTDVKIANEIEMNDLKFISENNLNNTSEENNVASKKLVSTNALVITKNSLEKDTTIVLKDSVVKIKVDSAISSTKKNTSEKYKPITLLSIDAGANYSLGWKNTTKEAAGFNGVVGLSVTHFFSEKWSILIGVQYNSLAHLSYSNYISSNMQYGFGYTETKTIITPTMLRYLVVPVKWQYWFNDKNGLSIGINALFLLNTNSNVETDMRSDFGATTSTFTTKAGYRDGFTNWDLQPTLTYRRKIYKACSLSAEVYYGLIDIKNNAAFGINKTENNSGLKLTLSYNILHK